MFTKSIEKVVEYLIQEAKNYAKGCKKIYISLSGGVDSAVVAMILTEAFGAENVIAVYRNVRSNPAHQDDAQELARAFGFKLMCFDFNPFYDDFLKECKDKFLSNNLSWFEEGEGDANWLSAYASFKSRMMTPFAGFISKAIDKNGGRIFGTGNIEEDLLLRYYDKFGDGAVDNNIIVGLTKMEVRQIALWFGEKYDAPICKKIAEKLPSADLQGNGDAHNDENELTMLARYYGFDIRLSYGSCTEEGNIAWICKQDISLGVITGKRSRWQKALRTKLGYSDEQVALTLFMRKMERATRHKNFNIPGVLRRQLRRAELVD
ncbi:MAG: NH(3)-dependent NAD(+) synthetase [Candidatus Moranbacteria bacterium GW2011_GWF1_34_10]|nr:MAG: NH(3)-dependent NAD(+) synthetase [Candidatus Moranbacteria bacterium GW2011_GWF1_34_10]